MARLAAALFILLVRFHARRCEVLGLTLWIIRSIPFLPGPFLFIFSPQGQTEQGQKTESDVAVLQTPGPPPTPTRSGPRLPPWVMRLQVTEGATSPLSCSSPRSSKQAPGSSKVFPRPFSVHLPTFSPSHPAAGSFGGGGALCSLTEPGCFHLPKTLCSP